MGGRVGNRKLHCWLWEGGGGSQFRWVTLPLNVLKIDSQLYRHSWRQRNGFSYKSAAPICVVCAPHHVFLLPPPSLPCPIPPGRLSVWCIVARQDQTAHGGGGGGGSEHSTAAMWARFFNTHFPPPDSNCFGKCAKLGWGDDDVDIHQLTRSDELYRDKNNKTLKNSPLRICLESSMVHVCVCVCVCVCVTFSLLSDGCMRLFIMYACSDKVRHLCQREVWGGSEGERKK